MERSIKLALTGLGLCASTILFISSSAVVHKKYNTYSNNQNVVEYNIAKSNLESHIRKKESLMGEGINLDENMSYEEIKDIQIMYNIDTERMYAAQRAIKAQEEKIRSLEEIPSVRRHNDAVEKRDNIEYILQLIGIGSLLSGLGLIFTSFLLGFYDIYKN